MARSKGSARGFTVDTIVADEAQDFGEDAMEALRSTNAAGPQQNPQLILTGTPPGPKADGEIFRRFRASALSGSSDHDLLGRVVRPQRRRLRRREDLGDRQPRLRHPHQPRHHHGTSAATCPKRASPESAWACGTRSQPTPSSTAGYWLRCADMASNPR
ncbi:hypothetical protein [Actinomyces qiguomingii]|uniref:hypothetical protein n=1 Tax=Actinomyces qiguomingii TaxID=2057800 RepID=UPI000FFF203C|nr:hypothetical protein [Actinomyces qiguomingii]